MVPITGLVRVLMLSNAGNRLTNEQEAAKIRS